MNKHLIAMGDRDSLITLKSVAAFSSIESMGLTGKTVSMVKFPLKYHTQYNLGVISQQKGFDGITGWTVDLNGTIHKDITEELKPMITELYFASYSYLLRGRNPGHNAYHGDTLINSRLYHQLVLYPEGGDSASVFINAETGLVDLKTSTMTGVRFITTYSDFRQIAGIMLPFHVATKGIDTPYEIVERVDSVRINPDLADSLFRIPSAPEIDYVFPEDIDSLIVDFKLVNNSIRIRVSVNGRGPFEFLLDSGAGSIMLSSRVAEKLRVSVKGEAPARGVGGFGEVGYGVIDSLNIGQLLLNLKRITVFDNRSMAGNSLGALDGILGYDFFARFPVKVDFENNRLILYNPRGIGPARIGEEVDIDIYCQIPLMEVYINDFSARLAVDLGANIGIMIMGHSKVYSENKEALKSDNQTAEISGIGGEHSVMSGRLESFGFGRQAIEKPIVHISDDFARMPFPEYIDGLLGVKILKEFNLLFVYGENRIYFDRRN
jgi:hypothetical protein